MAKLSVYLLGAPRVKLDEDEIEVKPRKALALLIYLAVTAERHTRDALATLLWPNSDQRKARQALRNRLSELNRALGNGWLEADRETVGLRDGFWLDVAALQQTLAEKPANLQSSQSAVALYRDNFLTGFTLPDCPEFDEWQFFQSEALRQSFAAGLEQLISLLSDQADYEIAIPHARRWLALDLLHEPAHQQLMRLYALTGQQAAALRQYQVCLETLEAELDIPPTEETTSLYEQIRTGGIRQDDQLTPAPFGQISSTSYTSSATIPRHNLPPQTTSFVGREDELSEIQRLLLEEADCRLVTLIGPGGTGKTRLALTVANQMLAAFSDGVFFVSLAPVSEATDIVPVIAEAMRFIFYDNADPKDQLLSYLSDKQMLLVIDNFEHLLVGADLLSNILGHAPQITLLATSRERLNVQEEWGYEVQGLRFPAEVSANQKDNAEALEAYSGLQLFLQRAKRALASFTPSNEDIAAMVRICQLVEGMPLALELAAPWIRTLSCGEIVIEIERSLDFLSTTQRNMPERHRSLRAVFEQTWGRLSDAEQATLQQLSVFRGGCTREAAEQVAGATLPVLSSLIDKALLRRTNTGRYEIHELICQFASMKLVEAQKSVVARNRHLHFYVNLVEDIEPQLYTGQQVAQRYAQLEAEHDNLRSALSWSLHDGDLSLGLRIVGSLYEFWVARGYLFEGQVLTEQFLTRMEATIRTPERAKVLLTAGGLAVNQHNYQIAQHLLTESESIARELGSKGHLILARVCIELGWIRLERQDFAEAERYGQEACILGQTLDEPWLYGHALNLLGSAASDQGDDPTARQSFDEAIKCCQPLGDTGVYGEALSGLGFLLIKQGDYATAHKYLTQSVSVFDTLGNQLGVAWSLMGLGDVAVAEKQFVEATTCYNKALTIQQAFKDHDHAGSTLEAMSRLAQKQGEWHQAEKYLREALVHYQKLTLEIQIANVFCSLANVMIAFGEQRHEETRQYFRQALELAIKQQLVSIALDVCVGVAQLSAEPGELEQAVELLALAEQHESRTFETKEKARQLLAELADQLPLATFRTAQAKGQALDWHQAAQDLIEHLQGAAQATPQNIARSERPRHNLPTQTTSFVGREDELVEIQRLLLAEERPADC